MLPVVLLLTFRAAVTHAFALASANLFVFIVKPPLNVCALFELFATGSANSYILRWVQVGVLYLGILVCPASQEDKPKSQMRVDYLHFSVRLLEGFAQIHDCAFDRPSLIDTEKERKFEASNLLCAEVCKKCVYVAVLELYLEAMFDGSHVKGLLKQFRRAFYLIYLDPFFDTILL